MVYTKWFMIAYTYFDISFTQIIYQSINMGCNSSCSNSSIARR